MTKKIVLGAHMSMAKGFPAAAKRTHEELNCNAMQLFLKSPRSSASKPLMQEDADQFKVLCKEHEINFVIGHASYLLNFAKPQDPKDNWQLANITDDLEKLGKLGGKGLVYHVGKSLKQTKAEALEHLYQNLAQVLKVAEKNNVALLLENCAGQGTEIGITFEEIAEVIKAMNNHKYLQVCVDTCHAFAAGYDLRTEQNVKDFFTKIESTIGLNKVMCFHFNDSLKELGSNRDRHANLGKGEIGMTGMKAFAKMAAKHQKPIILETPMVNDSHKIDIDIVKSWFN